MSVCLSVFSYDIPKTDAASMSKLVTEMFHDESWRPFYFGRQKVKVRCHKNIAGVGPPCTLVNAGFSSAFEVLDDNCAI